MPLASIWSAITAARASILTGLAVAAICTPLGYCEGKRAGKAKADAAAAVATVEVLKLDGSAKAVADNERRSDDASIASKKQELTDAVADLPDTMPSVRRVALACGRLRQQGTADADLPVACRSGGEAQAAAKP